MYDDDDMIVVWMIQDSFTDYRCNRRIGCRIYVRWSLTILRIALFLCDKWIKVRFCFLSKLMRCRCQYSASIWEPFTVMLPFANYFIDISRKWRQKFPQCFPENSPTILTCHGAYTNGISTDGYFRRGYWYFRKRTRQQCQLSPRCH